MEQPKDLPTFLNCANCIHAYAQKAVKNEITGKEEFPIICKSLETMVAIKTQFDANNDYVKFPFDPLLLAARCQEFKGKDGR